MREEKIAKPEGRERRQWWSARGGTHGSLKGGRGGREEIENLWKIFFRDKLLANWKRVNVFSIVWKRLQSQRFLHDCATLFFRVFFIRRHTIISAFPVFFLRRIRLKTTTGSRRIFHIHLEFWIRFLILFDEYIYICVHVLRETISRDEFLGYFAGKLIEREGTRNFLPRISF